MPLRVTVELIPKGNEAQKKVLGVLGIERTSDTDRYGDYELLFSKHDELGIAKQSVSHILRTDNVFVFLASILNAVYPKRKKGKKA